MELINGFEKTLYITKNEIEQHAKEYSQSYRSDLENGRTSSPWSKNFDAMAEKTVLKRLLTKFASTSIDLESSMLATAKLFLFPPKFLKKSTRTIPTKMLTWKRAKF